ncbi:universal stress protein, partial [Streptomyces chartreusis]|uniref:universal stress protein n=1 Tax=Streptomyces chartreusis TaxID=1969 RepID=UPI0036DF4052
MLPPVIVGVDGSAESLAAAEWAAREAVRRDRPLRLVHAWNWHPRQGAGEPATAAQRFLARRALRQAEDRIRRTCPGVKLDDEQIEGPATTALLQAADRADLLVLGSRGLS